MSKFNRFCAKIGRGFQKLGVKVEDTCDSAAAAVRTKGLQIRIDEQYENLGRIVYRDLHTEEDLEQQKLEIIAKIDALFDELESLKADKEAEEEVEQTTEECACECKCEAEEASATECVCEEAAPAEEKTEA